MAVIWKDKMTIEGKIFEVPTFMSDKFVIEKMQIQARELDAVIKKELKRIENEAGKNDLLKLKRKDGVIKLWYFIGKNIRNLIEKHVLPEDEKYIWVALWDNISNELAPGERESSRVGTKRDPLKYCYRLSGYKYKFVEKAGNWRAWTEFFDRNQNDERIIKWIGKNGSKTLQKDWLRHFNKSVHQRFKNVDTSVYTDEELDKELKNIWKKLFSNTG